MTQHVEHAALAYGDRGVMFTLGQMAGMIRRAPQSPLVMQTARALAGTSQRQSAQAIQFFVRRAFRYVDDPVYDEHLEDAEYMLLEYERTAMVKGDCDEAAILAGSLALAIGIPVELTVLAFDDGTGDAPHFSHVFATLLPNDGPRVSADVTRPQWNGAQVVKSLTVAV